MNTRFPDALIATTTATSGAYSLAGTVSFGANPDSFLVDGKVYAYYVRWPDNTTAGFEEGLGVYSASGAGSISRLVVTNSTAGVDSNGNMNPYTFAAGTKHIAITTPGSELANMASIFIGLAPWHDPLVGGIGQSNIDQINYFREEATGTARVANPNVLHYCTATGTTGGTPTTPVWRAYNPHEYYGYELTQTAILGAGRQYDTTSEDWFGSVTETANLTYELAGLLQVFLGRKIRVVNVSASGATIDHSTNGFGYDPSITTRCSSYFADCVTRGIAAMVADDPTQAIGIDGAAVDRKLNLMVYMQGEGDSAIKTSGEYAELLSRFIFDCEDPLLHGICDRDYTKYLLIDIPDTVRNSNPQFNGHSIAKRLIGNRAILVTPPRWAPMQYYLNIHYYGDEIVQLAKDCFSALVSPVSSTDDDFHALREFTTPFSGVTFSLDTIGTSAPSNASVRISTNSAGVGTLRMDNDDQSFVTAWLAEGILRLGKGAGFWMVQGAVTKYVMITGPSTDNTTYATWPCQFYSNGSMTTGSDVVMTAFRPCFDGTSYRLSVDLTVENTAVGSDTTTPYRGSYWVDSTEEAAQAAPSVVGKSGQLMRALNSAPYYGIVNTTNATAQTVNLHAEDLMDTSCPIGAMAYFEITVVARITGGASAGGFEGNTAAWKLTGVYERTTQIAGALLTTYSTITQLYSEDAANFGVVSGVVPGVNSGGVTATNAGFGFKATGKTGFNITWVGHGFSVITAVV